MSIQRLRDDLEFVRLDLEDRVLTMTIARAAVGNALHPPACRELGLALDWLDGNDEAAVGIVTGEGEHTFSAGFDLRYAEAHPEVYGDPMVASEIVRRPQDGKPLIAAVNGTAMGLGFELALACDLIVAAPHARFALPEPRVGLTAMGGGVVRLCRQIGLKRALAIVLTARSVSAEEGIALGFVNEVASAEPVLACARRWAAQVAACAPLAIRASKQMAYANFDQPDLATALDPRRYPRVLEVLGSADVHEGRQAFLQKRAPEWTGR